MMSEESEEVEESLEAEEGEEEEEESISRIPIRFRIEGVGEAEGELVRHLAPRTVDAIVKQLPFQGRSALWKEEVYFEIPVQVL